MPKNPNQLTRKDTAQIQKSVYCDQHDAYRVIPAVDVETEISLSHKDKDSIASMADCRVLPVNELVDCSDLKTIQSYGDGKVILFANETTSYAFEISVGQILDICAMNLKSDVVLVGR